LDLITLERCGVTVRDEQSENIDEGGGVEMSGDSAAKIWVSMKCRDSTFTDDSGEREVGGEYVFAEKKRGGG